MSTISATDQEAQLIPVIVRWLAGDGNVIDKDDHELYCRSDTN